ncbi:MAG TPA: DUF6252 family protein [Puia sp.]|nr:DUF6252 family protein [Puia sp.]
MKTSKILLLIFFGGWIFSACKKEYSIENATITTANFTAVINGTQWAATTAAEGATLLGGMLNVTGISADSQEISITLTDTSLGVHTLSPQTSSLAVLGFIDSSYTTNFSTSQGTDSTQAGGEVDLTQINTLTKTVSGTFSFKVYRSSDGAQRTIASGIFSNIPYTSTLPGSNPGDTVTASIDNAAFTGESIQASITDNQLTILGSTSTGTQSVALIFPANATIGSHALTPSGASPAYMAVYDFVGASGGNTAAPANAGTINILENNAATSRIRGNFSFTTTDSTGSSTNHAITGGFFSVYYGK